MKLVLLFSQLTSFGHFVYEAAFCCTLWRSSFVGPKGGGEGGKGQKITITMAFFICSKELPSNLGCCWFDFRWHGRRSEALIRHFSAKRTETTILDEKGRKKGEKRENENYNNIHILLRMLTPTNEYFLLLLLLLLLWSLSSPKSNKLSFVLMNEVPLQFQEWPT